MKKNVMIFMIAVMLLSCRKETSNRTLSEDDQATSGTVDLQGESVESALMTTSTAYTCDPIPTPGTWDIKPSFMNAYQHFYQIDAKPDYPGSVLCGPTSYMLAAHMIVTAKGGIYPSSKAKLGAIYTKLSQAGRFDDAAGMYIGDLTWFNTNYDYPVIKTSYKRTADRVAMKEYIEYFIKTGYPVVVTVNIYGMQGAYWTNDLDMTDQPNVKYYISKDAPVGHFILLTGIKINADGSGRVWYKDPLSKTGETRCVSYTRLLDAMKYNGNNDYYDAVAVFE